MSTSDYNGNPVAYLSALDGKLEPLAAQETLKLLKPDLSTLYASDRAAFSLAVALMKDKCGISRPDLIAWVKPPASTQEEVEQEEPEDEIDLPEYSGNLIEYLSALPTSLSAVDAQEVLTIVKLNLADLYVNDRAAFAVVATLVNEKLGIGRRDLEVAIKPLCDTSGTADQSLPYAETEHGLVWNKTTRDGSVPVELCNFTARIIVDAIHDDGAETKRAYEIEARQAGHVARITVSAERFPSLNWVSDALGAHAILAPGPSLREHTRVAIQYLSIPVPRKHLYTHLGWRKINEQWLYLHANGAIGAGEEAAAIEVAVPAALERYVLPSPPTGEERTRAIQSSFRLLRVAPLRVTGPICAAVWRALLGDTDFSEHVVGETGEGKTALVACALQHHGPELTARHLPGSWSSTGNSLEGLAFIAKDSLLVIDDFCPSGSVTDIQRYHREADRILRAQGNTAGRLRMKADATLRPAKPPRGTILSTGEDVPRGHSLRARTLVVELPKESMDWKRLSECQKDAATGLYAQALSAFVSWVGSRYEELKARIKKNTEDWRLTIASEHKRTGDIVASLAAGFDIFLSFALESEAITESEKDALWKEVWQALIASSAAQAQHQADSDPARRFLELITSALSSGRAHFAGPDGGEPADLELWGWESTYLNNGERIAKSHGEKCGWIDRENLYLDPESSYAVAQKLQRDQNESLPVTAQTLRKRLKEKGYLASFDVARETATVRRVLEGKSRPVLHMSKEIFSQGLYPDKKPDKPDIDPGDTPDPSQEAESATKKPDISCPEPDKPDIDPTLKNPDESNGYPQNVGNVGFSCTLEGQAEQKENESLFGAKTAGGNVGSSQNQNPTSRHQNPTFDNDAREEWEAEL